MANEGKREDGEPWSAEWREVQDQRYNKGYYPQSGKINPFFSRMGAADRRFGWQLLFVAFICAAIAVPVWFYEKLAILPFLIFGGICLIGGIQHLRMTRGR
jgi:hypothetical protein